MKTPDAWRSLGIILAVSATVLLAGCPPNLELKGGIITETFIAPQDELWLQTPQGGVNDTGEFLGYLSGGHQNGSEQSFNGTTDYTGIDDHPNAVDDAEWDLETDYTAATGGVCLSSAMYQITVPTGGLTQPWICELPPF